MVAGPRTNDDLIEWGWGTQGYPGTPKMLYMYTKVDHFMTTDLKWYPRPAHLIICKNVVYACLRDHATWPQIILHQREFKTTEIEEAKAWCEIMWRMCK